jgi:hypothetical protein
LSLPASVSEICGALNLWASFAWSSGAAEQATITEFPPQIQNSTENERTGPLPIEVRMFIRKMCLNYLDTA